MFIFLLTLSSPKGQSISNISSEIGVLGYFMFFVLSCVCNVFVRVCLYVLCGHLLGKG